MFCSWYPWVAKVLAGISLLTVSRHSSETQESVPRQARRSALHMCRHSRGGSGRLFAAAGARAPNHGSVGLLSGVPLQEPGVGVFGHDISKCSVRFSRIPGSDMLSMQTTSLRSTTSLGGPAPSETDGAAEPGLSKPSSGSPPGEGGLLLWASSSLWATRRSS